MGARASRRRHEGRVFRKQKRVWRELGESFYQMGVSAKKVTRAFVHLVNVIDTPSGSIAFAQRPDGSTVLGIDPGTGAPSQTGVEAVRSTHSAAEKVDATATKMGLRLLPWQRDAAIAALEGRPLALAGGKQCGRTTVLQVIETARGPESGPAWVDELQ